MELKEVEVDQIEAPNRSKKLHPYEEEEEESWENFKKSIKKRIRDPLKVRENGDGYELIDGDRRLRAAKEVDRETVPVYVEDEDVVSSEAERIAEMVAANEFREPSDKKQRARLIMQLNKPWYLPPAERLEETKQRIENEAERVALRTQSELADEIGVTTATISRWAGDPSMGENYVLRDALGGIASGNSLDGESVKQIDNTVEVLDDVLFAGEKQYAAEEIADMEGVTLSEVESTAEKAAKDGWDCDAFLQYQYLTKHRQLT